MKTRTGSSLSAGLSRLLSLALFGLSTLSAFAQAPTITTQPQSQAVNAGTNVTFTVVATGAPAPTYHWKKDSVNLTDGGNISGATSATLALANVQTVDAGSYTCVVTNGAGSVTSDVATLGVNTAAGVFSATGSMSAARCGHTATLLLNGKILIAGGGGISSSLASAELYDPATETFSPTGSMAVARSSHAATLLPDGRVLITGGADVASDVNFSSAELYDPATGTFSPTGDMATMRSGHTATLLPNGKVLIASGSPGSYLETNTAELYDPATRIFTLTGSLGIPRHAHCAVLLPNGKVLVVGGGRSAGELICSSAELYDPGTGTFTATGSMAQGRVSFTATLLPNGKVLISGGEGVPPSYAALRGAELYDPATGIFSPTGNLGTARLAHTAILLPSGKVLIAGGLWNDGSWSSGVSVASAELYDPTSQSFAATASMAGARHGHTATLLANGEVALTGGIVLVAGSQAALASAELYHLGTPTDQFIFEENFSANQLNAPWQVVNIAGRGRYSTTENPGNLRYYSEGNQTYQGGWAQNYSNNNWSAATTLIRPFAGDDWKLSAKVNYNLHNRIGGNSTGAQGQSLFIAFGDGNRNYIYINRGVDYWYSANSLAVQLVNDGGSPAEYLDSTTYLAADDVDQNEWMRHAYWYTVNRSGQEITLLISGDGLVYRQALSFTLPATVGLTQRVIIDGGEWAPAGSYADWDYIVASQNTAVSGSPAITTQPASQTKVAGANVTLTVVASGAAPLSYQWRKGIVNLADGGNISGSASATLALTNVQTTDAGSYAVVITNGAGSIISNAATLTVNLPAGYPTISTQPQSQTVTTGGNVTFTVAATGTAPLSYQWQKNGAAITGATGATLTLTNVQSADAGTYTVVVSNSAGSVTSSAAVIYGILCYYNGHTYQLTPNALLWNDAESWAISRGGHLVAINSQAEQDFLLSVFGADQSYWIGLSDQNDEGNWTTWSNGEPVTYSNWARGEPNNANGGESFAVMNSQPGIVPWNDLPDNTQVGIVEYAFIPVEPVIGTQPLSQQANKGDNVTYSVVATGSAPLTYQWFCNGVPIPGATNPTLPLLAVQPINAGTYTVTVANAFGSATSNAATLTGSSAPPAITAQPQNVTVTSGQPATLSVTATGTTLAYQWRRNGFAIAGATGASYTIPSAARADADFYDVVVFDGLTPAVSQTVRLSVAPISYPGLLVNDPAANLKMTRRWGNAYATAMATDGSFYVGGDFIAVDGQSRMNIAHFNAAGTLDGTFAPTKLNGRVWTILPQADGKVLVGGEFYNVVGATRTFSGLVRLNSDGSLDETMLLPGVNQTIYTLALQSDGKLLVGGGYGGSNGTPGNMARFNADGTLDAAFNPNVNGTVRHVLVQTDGKILIGGSFTSVGSTTRNRLARLNADGTLDSTFDPGTGANNDVRRIRALSDGRLVIVGYFSTYAGVNVGQLARLQSNGTLDATFNAGTGANSNLEDVLVLPGDKLVIAGYLNQYNGTNRVDLAWLNADGSLDIGFNANSGGGGVTALARQSDGKLIVVGGFSSLAGGNRQGIARLSADGTLDPSVNSVPVFPAQVRAMANAPGGKLIVAGNFTTINGAAVNRIARLNADGSIDAMFNTGTGPSNDIDDVCLLPDGGILLFGSFGQFDGANRSGVAWLNADGHLDTAHALATNEWIGGMQAAPVLLPSGRILIATNQSNWGGAPVYGLLVLNADGTRDTSFDVGSGAGQGSNAIRALAVQADGKVLAAGNFTSFNGQNWNKIVRLNSDGSLDQTFHSGTGNGVSGSVNVVSVQPDGKILTGGNGIVRQNADGTADTGFTAPFLGNVRAILRQPDAKILVSWDFNNIADLSSSRLCRLNENGTVDYSFGVSGQDHAVDILALTDSGQLYGASRNSTNNDGLICYTAGSAVAIVTSPANQTPALGGTATFSVTATGTPAPTYQWFFNGVPIPGATNPTLTNPHILPIDVGTYHVLVTNAFGTVISNTVTLTGTGPAPTITAQPQNVTATSGQPATLSVTATGIALGYQWRRNGKPITGATGASYTIPSAVRADADFYDVVVYDGLTPAFSQTVRLSVAPTSYPGLLVNDPAANLKMTRLSGNANVTVVAADGKFYVGGEFISMDGQPRTNLARFNADGSLDMAFVPTMLNNRVYAILPLSGGKVLVGGNFTDVVGASRTFNGLVQLNADGSLDQTAQFPGLNPGINTLVQQSDGKILVGGGYGGYNGTPNNLSRFKADGTLDAMFNPNVNGTVRHVLVQSDLKILIGGSFTSVNGTTRNRLARLNPDGTLDTTFDPGTGANNDVRRVRVLSDGRLMIVGYFSTYNGVAVGRLARLQSNGTLDQSFNAGTGANNNLEEALVLPGDKLVIAGYLNQYNGTNRTDLAWLNADGTLDITVNANSGGGGVTAVARFADGRLVVAGGFSSIAGGNRQSLARLNADGTLDPSVSSAPVFPAQVATMINAPGGKLIVAGNFTTLNGAAVNRITRLNADGSIDATFNTGTGPNGDIDDVCLLPDGGILLFGSFGQFDGASRSGVVWLNADGHLDTAHALATNEWIGSMQAAPVLLPSGRILIATNQSNWGGAPVYGMLALNADGTRDTSFDVGSGAGQGSNAIRALAVQSDGKVIVGGRFNTFNGQSCNRLVRLNADGSFDSSFTIGAGPNGDVQSIVIQPGNKILIGGYFNSYNGTTRNGCARLNADGTLDTTYAPPNLGNNVGALLWQEDGMVIAGGWFGSVNNQPNTSYLARLNADGTLDGSFAVAAQFVGPDVLALTDTGRLYGASRDGVNNEGLVRYAAGSAPAISAAPTNQTATFGDTVTFTVGATGTAPLSYQWCFNGVALAGATGQALTIVNAQPKDSGDYTVVVTNPFGSATSTAASAVVNGPPIGTAETPWQKVFAGSNATFSVSATAATGFQWQRSTDGGVNWTTLTEGTPFSGVSTATLTVSGVSAGMNGWLFRATESNSYGAATSDPLPLTLMPTPTVTGTAWLAGGEGSYFPVPTPKAIMGGVLDLSAGGGHSMVIKTDGSLWATGSNVYGQLGDGTKIDRDVPEQVTTGVLRVSAGASHTMFIKTDETLWGMGQNYAGALGNGTIIDQSIPVQVPGAANVTAVAAGSGHTLFLKADGTLWAMGTNNGDVQSDGTTTIRISPVPVASGVRSIAATLYSGASYFVKSDDTLWSVGNNSNGELGDGTTVSRPTPQQVATGVASVAAGGLHAMYLKTDGTLWGMGCNNSGQLGDGSTTNRLTAVQIASGVARVSAGSAHTIFTKIDGTVWGMGAADGGVLLNPALTSSQTTPVQLPGGMAKVVAGSGLTMFIGADGVLWAVGNNNSGQLGDGQISVGMIPLSTSGIVSATIGQQLSNLFVRNDGTLWEQPAGLRNAALKPVSGVTGVVQAMSSSYNQKQLYLKGDGTLWLLAADRTSSQVASGVISAGAGVDYFAYLKSDGTLWGQGGDGWAIQFGDGSTPVRIADHVESLAASGWYLLYVRSDHTLWGQGFPWGGLLPGDWAISTSAPVQLATGIASAVPNTDQILYITTDGTLWTRGNGFSDGTGPAVIVDTDVVTATSCGNKALYLKADDVLRSRSGVMGTLGPITTVADGIAFVAGSSDGFGDFFFVQTAGFGTAPTITQAPQSATAVAGTACTLTAAATGTGPVSYQWSKDGVAISWARAAQLTIPYATAADAGAYTVTVTNSAGSVTSNAAMLSVIALPTIAGFSPATITQGMPVVITGTGFTGATGVQFNGVAASSFTVGSDTQITAIVPSGPLTNGPITVTSAGGTATSATNFVVLAPPSDALINLSTRVNVGPGSQALTGAFTVEGSAPKQLLIRAVGPTLAQYGISGTMPDPQLSVFDSTSALVTSNQDWGGTPELEAAFAQMGAFALLPGSKDAAILANFNPGTYTVSVSDQNNASGIVLLEVYDMPNGSPRLVYLSSRAFAGAGANTQITGFVVAGSSPRAYLIRALGPSLGISGALADPQLVLYNGQGQIVASNDNWAGDALISAAAANAGAMPIPGASKDAALLVTLSPGAYTAQVTGVGNTSGIALLEIFETDSQRAANVPAAIVSQPANATVPTGGNATFGVVTTGKPAPTYQWQKNGAAIDGATGATLALSNVQSPGDAGIYSVLVTQGSTSITSLPATLVVVPPPTIAGFTPTTIAAGMQVTITGTNFTGATGVQFNGVNASGFTIDSSTQITAVVPNTALTNGPITVTTAAGTATSPGSFVLSSGPTITSFTPPTITAGSKVIITGTNFTGATAVQFNGVDAGFFTVISATQIVAMVPNVPLTNGSIMVATASGTTASSTSFVYSASPVISGRLANSMTTVGSYAVLSVAALGLPPLNYQWYKDGAPIAGATLGSYVMNPVQAGDAGTYSVAVSNGSGSVTSNPAMLTVTAFEPYTFTTLAGRAAAGTDDGTGPAARFNGPSSVVRDSQGNLFVADSGSASIRKIVPATGAVTTFVGRVGVAGSADGTGSAAQFSANASPNSSLSLAIDGADNLYVADYGNNTIRKVTPAGVVSTLAGLAGNPGSADGHGSAARFHYPQSIAVDPAGNVYVGEAWNYTIRKITPAGDVTTLAGPIGVSLASSGPTGNVDATGSAARFGLPYGLAADGAGNVYVADGGSNKTIRKVTSTGVVTTIAGVAGSPGTTDGGALATARFSNPVAVAVNAAARSPGVAATILYVSDGNRLRQVDLGAATVTSLAGSAVVLANNYVDGVGAAASFNNPRGLTVDATGTNVYVADFSNNAIRAMVISSTVVTTLAGSPSTAGSGNGPGSAARFNGPQSVAPDHLGNIYVADTTNNVIRKIDAAGNVTTFAGTVGAMGTPAASDGPIAGALFNNPAGLATDSANNVYVADTGNNAIRKITVSTGQVSTLAGATDGSSGTTDANGISARFYNPHGLAVDSVGNVFVADQTNHTIRKISPAGDVTTVAGLARTSGNVDGTGSVVRFNNPWDVAVDSAGNVYVADRSNSALRQISTSGFVSTVLNEGNLVLGVGIDATDNVYVTGATGVIFKVTPTGTITAIAGLMGDTGSADGTGAAARFSSSASGLKVDSAGKVYVADTGNNMIRKGWPAILTPPVITAQPASQTVTLGSNATFAVAATGTPTYQWSLNGVALVDGLQPDGSTVSGATTATLTITGTTGAESAGTYRVTLTNGAGSVASSAAVLSLRPTGAGAPSFTAVGDLPGGAFGSSVRAATEDGQIAVGSGSVLVGGSSNAGDRPFLWTSTAGMKELPEPVTITAGTLFLTGSDITPDGAVIAGRVRRSPTANLREPAIWTNDGKTLTVIPEIAGYSGGRGAANAISSNGTVVYGWSSETTAGKWQAFRWTAATGTVGLGFLNASDTQSFPAARGVSADGSVMAGTATASDGTTQTAFIYTVGGGMHSLGYLPGGTWSQALGLTPDGVTVFGLGSSQDFPGGQYFTWTQGGGMVPLGVGDIDNAPGVLGGISADGQVVVCGSYVRNGNGFMEVTRVLVNAGLNITGWSQFSILGISQNGNVLFGQAIDPSGNYEGWVATFAPGYLRGLALPAAIARQPVSQTAIAGSGAIFGVGASGGPGVSFQWYLNGVSLSDGIQPDGTTISGSTTLALRLGNLALARNGGGYTVRVGNSQGQAISSPAILTVTPPAVVSALVAGDPKLTAPLNLASDGTYLYVAGANAATTDPNRSSTGQSLFRVPITGGTAVSLYPALNPQQLAVVGGNLDWIDPTSGAGTTQILGAPAVGGGTVTAIYNQPTNQVIASGEGLAADGTSLYATDGNQGLAFRLNANGTGLTQLGGVRYTTGGQPNALAVSQGVIYIVDSGESTGLPDVVSIPTSGSGAFTTLYGDETGLFVDPAGIAVGNGMIYVSDPGANNTIWELPISGGNPVALVSGAPFSQLAGLTYANGVLYAADTGNNTIYKILLSGPATAVVWTNAVGVTAQGNNLTRGNDAAGWAAGAVSTQGIVSQDGYVEFTATETNTYRMCGLSHGDANQSYTDIDYAIYLTAGGTVQVYESGVFRGDFGAYATGDVFRVALEGGAIRYRKNGTLFYTSTVAPTLPLLVDTSLYSPGATLANVVVNGTLQIVAVTSPAFDVPTGNYAVAQTVHVTEATPGATIHYTINGANPTESDPTVVSGGAIVVDHGLTLKARAFQAGLVPSSVTTATYTIGTIVTAPVVWTNAVGVTAQGNNLTRGNAAAGWDAGAVSTQGIGSQDGYVEFTAMETNTYRMCGLSHGDANQNYTDIAYAIYLTAGGTVQVYEGGVSRGDFGAYATGDVFRVALEGGAIRYRKNGTLFYTSTVAPTLPLLVDTSLYSPGATLANVVVNGTLQIVAVTSPVFDVPTGNYAAAQTVHITEATPGATIHYTTNDADPTESDSKLASGGVVLVNQGLTLKARAFQSGLIPSSVTTATYTIGAVVTAPVVWTNAVGVTAQGNNLTRGNAAAGWDAGAVSTQGIGSQDGYVEFTATETNTYRMCGLSHGDANQNYTDIAYAIYLTADGTMQVYESGVSRGNFGAYATGDVFRVALEGGAIKYRKNGTLFYTSTVAPTLPLLVDASLYSPGATLVNVVISGTLQIVAVTSPTFDVPTGNYTVAKTVHVTEATPGAAIHYTTNGADPTESDSTVVSGGAVVVDHGLTLKARAFQSGLVPSSVTTATYTIGTIVTAPVVWTNGVGVSATGNNLTRGNAAAGWDAGAVSTQGIGSQDGYVEFTATETNTYRMCGLSHGDANQSYTDIDYAIYLTAGGTVQVYEGGVFRGDFGAYATGDVFRVALEGGAIKYRKNGTLFYTSATPPTLPLLVDTSLYSPGATLANVVVNGTLEVAAP